MTMFDKWRLFDLSWKAQHLYLPSKALQPFGVQEGDGSFLGAFAPCVLPATLYCDRKSLPGCLWLLENPSYLLVPEISWSSHNQCSFRQNTSLSRYPDWLSAKVSIAMFYGFTASFGKDHLCKNVFFFSWVANMSQKPLLLRNQGLTTILQSADFLFTFYLCELALVRLLRI